MEIQIDPEFHGLIPKISEQELSGLEESIVLEGCRDPIVLWDDIILDGHNRYEICKKNEIKFKIIGKTFDNRNEAKLWIIKNQFNRRNLNDFQRAELALKLKPLLASQAKEKQRESGGAVVQKSGKPPIKTDREVAKLAGVSHDTINRVEKILKEAHPERIEKVRSGKESINKSFKDIKTAKRNERLKIREEAAKKEDVKSDKKFDLIVSDIKSLNLPPNSIDAIITDPPYAKEYISLYESLSLIASKVLKDGAPCVVMIGQSHIEETIHNLSKHLSYQWTLAYLTPGSSVQVFERKIKSNWKPIIFLSKGGNNWEHISDIVHSDQEDKRFHEWGQSVNGMISLIERFTVKNQTVLDPFCGGGTTGISCLLTDRLFIGSDISKEEIRKTKERLVSL